MGRYLAARSEGLPLLSEENSNELRLVDRILPASALEICRHCAEFRDVVEIFRKLSLKF
jgi:hypothetical protein